MLMPRFAIIIPKLAIFVPKLGMIIAHCGMRISVNFSGEVEYLRRPMKLYSCSLTRASCKCFKL